jgi:hypothetical protein
VTVAVLDGDYRRTDAAGRLDLDRTVDVLRGAEALMDAALAAGRSTPPPSAEGEAAAPRDAEAGAKIDALLRFLPVFEAADADHGEWRLAGGVMPYLVTSEAVTGFVEALYGNGWVEPFDWGAWQETAAGYAGSPERVATADIDTIRKLLTTHVRKDRFCEGHLVAMIASGHIAAVLRRLRDLRGPAK